MHKSSRSVTQGKFMMGEEKFTKLNPYFLVSTTAGLPYEPAAGAFNRLLIIFTGYNCCIRPKYFSNLCLMILRST